MNEKKETIEDLFTDSGDIDEAAIVRVIRPFVTIQKSTNEIFLKKSNVTAEQRVLIYGLAKKLLKSKGLIPDDMITTAEILKKTGLKKGTIDPTFMKLKSNGFLIGKSNCEIPGFKVSEVIDIIERTK